MIRINLLSGERRAKPISSFDIGQKLTVAASLILVTTALGVGWWYWSLRTQMAKLDEDIAAARLETEQLQNVLTQLEALDARRAQLQQRVSLIEELRRGQSGPVHLLDEVSRSMPDRLWLTALRQEGVGLTLEGRASTLTALSDFVGNLESSAFFKRPVEIINSEIDAQGDGDLIRFSVKAEFQTPGP